jgi:hypothetical protein
MRVPAVVAFVGVIFAACGAGVAPTGSADGGSPEPSPFVGVSPSTQVAEPSPTAPLPTGLLPTPLQPETVLVNSAVRVAVPELNVRERPSLASKKLGVVTPDNVMFLSGSAPVIADGYVWYSGGVVSATGKLPPLLEYLGDGEPLHGWIAVAKGATQFVERLAPRCPSTIDLLNVSAMLGAERLACFGSNTIVLEGVFGCNGCGGQEPGTFEPAWLASPLTFAFLSVDPSKGTGHIVLRFPPAGPPEPAVASIIRVRGHFDDERASDCAIALPVPAASFETDLAPMDPAVARVLCRQEFVVESYEIIGTDPNFPSGA